MSVDLLPDGSGSLVRLSCLGLLRDEAVGFPLPQHTELLLIDLSVRLSGFAWGMVVGVLDVVSRPGWSCAAPGNWGSGLGGLINLILKVKRVPYFHWGVVRWRALRCARGICVVIYLQATSPALWHWSWPTDHRWWCYWWAWDSAWRCESSSCSVRQYWRWRGRWKPCGLVPSVLKQCTLMVYWCSLLKML